MDQELVNVEPPAEICLDAKPNVKMNFIPLENDKTPSGTYRPREMMANDVTDTTRSEEEEHLDTVTEGKAVVLMPSSKNVFYNPVQEFNRDLSIAVLRVFAQDNIDESLRPSLTAGIKYESGLTILEALSASGLRSIRYAKEIPGIKQIIANDISPSAVASIKANAARNNVDHLVAASHNDASMLMLRHATKDRFNVVDLDPYGCPSIFLDSAVQCVADGGLLLVTCTDMGVLSGNSPETCYSKYGAISIRVPSCHEMALRIVLQCVESHANRHDRFIVPLLSISADFYVRVFVKVFTIAGPYPMDKLSMVYHCIGCHTVTLQPLSVRRADGDGSQPPDGPPVGPECQHCKQKHTIGGPVWNAPLHDAAFVSRLQDVARAEDLGTSKRMQGMLAVVGEELLDVCLYHALDKLCSVVHTQVLPMMTFRSALINAGYRVSYSHANKSSIKTDAPARVVWDVLRCWVRQHPVKKERLIGAALAILSQQPQTEISFEWNAEANPASRLAGLVRFQANPQPHWGPGTRSKSNYQGEGQMEKKKRNQNRFKNKRMKREELAGETIRKCAKTEESDDKLRTVQEQVDEEGGVSGSDEAKSARMEESDDKQSMDQ